MENASNMRLIREDEEGIYILLGDSRHRPGDISGYSHAYRMDSGGLTAGMKVKARHVSQTELMKLTLEDGTHRYWGGPYLHKMEASHSSGPGTSASVARSFARMGAKIVKLRKA